MFETGETYVGPGVPRLDSWFCVSVFCRYCPAFGPSSIGRRWRSLTGVCTTSTDAPWQRGRVGVTT